MKADYVHKDTLTATDYVELNKNNELLISYNQALLKENQELKLELSGYRQAILDNKEMLGLKEQNDKLKKQYENAVADYETTMFEKEQLKKQLEEANKKLYLCTPEIPQNIHGKNVSYVDLVNEMYELKKQQKEFIKYLEDMLDDESDMFSVVRVKDVLQKYIEITNGSEQN